MKLNEFIKELRAKYNSVSLKKIAFKKQYELYHFCYKNKREQNEIVLVSKKTKEICKREKIKKSVNIKELATNFKKGIEIYSKEFEAQKKNFIKKSQNTGVRNIIKADKKITNIKQKKQKERQKKLSDFKFKNEKQKKDILYMWFVFSFLREHLIQNELVTIGKNNEPILKSDKMIDKKLLKFLNEVGAELTEKGVRDNSVKLDIIQSLQKTTYNKVLSKTHQEDMFYIITLLYMLKMWKLDNDFKKLFIPIDNEFIEPYLEYMTNYLLKEDEKVTENSIKIAFYLFEEIYKKFPTKTFFRDKMAKKIITKG